jgi:hypothetical protein
MHKVRGEVIIVVVQAGSVKIYEAAAAAVEALKKKGKCGSNQDERNSQFSGGALQEKGKRGSNQDMKLKFSTTKRCTHFGVSPLVEDYSTFLQVLFESFTKLWTKLRVLVLCFPDFTRIL